MPKQESDIAWVRDFLDKDFTIPEIARALHATPETIQKLINATEREDRRKAAQAEAILRAASQGRPFPSEELLGRYDWFEPSTALQDWVIRVFLKENGPLYNGVHRHLWYAVPQFLWSTMPYKKGGQIVAGTAEMLGDQASSWSKGRANQQIKQWFRQLPRFLITLDAEISAGMSDVDFCALVEHELLHCGQAKDVFGSPAYTRDGLPKFCLRGHDVEEFVDIVDRYGPGSGAGQTAALVHAGSRPPSVARAKIAQACGTCR